MNKKRGLLRVLKYTAAGMVVGGVLLSILCLGHGELSMSLLNCFIALVFAWTECLVLPFVGSTGLIKSFPLELLAGILLALTVRHFVRPYPTWWPRFAVIGAFAATVLAPLTFWTALMLLRFRGSAVRGHWLQPMADDPKYIGQNDPWYQRLYHCVDCASAFSGVFLYLTVALILHLALSGNLPLRRFGWLCVVFVGGWLFFLFASPGLYFWWMD